MANREQVAILKLAVEAWNAWRKEHPNEKLDLHGADLHGADLHGAHLRGVELFRTNLSGANLMGADLNSAVLFETDLNGADLSMADLSGAVLYGTRFGDTDLTSAKGLETCRHAGPSTLDHRTLAKSGRLSLAFLRGVGLPERLIEYLPSLLVEVLQFYACFISYSSKDQAFAERLHADLQNKGVRCWFAPHDLPIGAETRSAIDEAIRRYDKLLLVLSENSVRSNWVKKEVETAFEREERSGQFVLFPVRLDDSVFEVESGWAADVRRMRNIGDMRQWKDHDAYQRGFERLLRDLRAESAAPPQ